MFGDDVCLDVHPRTGRQMPEIGVAQGVFDERKLDDAGSQVVDSEADAIDGDRPVQYEQGVERRWQRHVHEKSIPISLDCRHPPDAIDVALDDMTTKPVARL